MMQQTPSSLTSAPAPWRRYLQFTIRLPLAAMLLVAIAGSYLSWLRSKYQTQAEAVDVIEKYGGWIYKKPERSWLSYLVGRDICFRVAEISLTECRDAPEVIDSLTKVFTLETLDTAPDAVHPYPFTDDDLAKIRCLTGLRQIILGDTRLSDKGIEYLGAFKNLVYVDLSGTGFTDETLRRLPPLRKLKELNLLATRITDSGLPYLSKFPCLEDLQIILDSDVSDAGVDSLLQLRSLKRLDITQTGISAVGLGRLQERLSQTGVRYDSDNLQPPGTRSSPGEDHD